MSLDQDQIDAAPCQEDRSLAMVGHLEIKVSALIGEKKIRLDQLLSLRAGDCLKLGNDLDAPVVVFANERPFARAEIVVVEERLGVRVIEIL